MKRIAPTAVVLALLLVAGWFAVPKAQRPGPTAQPDEAPVVLPDTPEGDYARRLIEAGGFPEPIRVAALLDLFDGNPVAGEYTGKLVIVVGTVAKVDGATVDFADTKGRATFCRATFSQRPGLQPGDVVTVAGDCRGLTGAAVQLADCVLLTDEFTANVAELLAAVGKAGAK
jgi:tRNA_anti-like